jgi:hypothetical protein
MRRTAGLATATLISFSSLAYGQAGPQGACQVAWSDATSACAFEVVEVDKPIVVRAVAGTIANEGGGTWPPGVDVAVELASSKDPSVRYVGQASIPSGRFKVERVAPGDYCFRIAIRPLGWSCVQGRVVASRTAPAQSRMDVTVPLGR